MDAGKLTLSVIWDGNSVCATEILSTRPMVAQILKNKTPTQVLQIVPLLYSVCGYAQVAAAAAALQAAQQGEAAASAADERSIVCEAIQEHLWRILLDWPRLLGLPQREQLFTGWYALLRRIAAGEVDMDAFLREFERDALGMPVAEWRGLDSHARLQTWLSKAHSPVAQVLLEMNALQQDGAAATGKRWLPAWTAAEASRACVGKWNAAFSARPDWLGETAETGAWTYYTDNRLLQDVRQQGGSAMLIRLLARVLDVVEMASGNAPARLDAASPAPGEGVAVVRTARGLLMHHVRLAAEQVTEYEIVAPTEWNFHPDGVFAQDMRELAVQDAARLKQMAHIEVLSLDPCVVYEIEVRHYG